MIIDRAIEGTEIEKLLFQTFCLVSQTVSIAKIRQSRVERQLLKIDSYKFAINEIDFRWLLVNYNPWNSSAPENQSNSSIILLHLIRLLIELSLT